MKSCIAWIVLGVVACWTGAAMAQGPDVATGAVSDPAYDQPAAKAADRVAHKADRVAHKADRVAHRADRVAHKADRVAHKRVSVFREPTGKRVLVIEYPWKVHAKPSVEVRLLGRGEPEDLKIQPIYFRWKYMKGDKVTLAVYRVQDTCEATPASAVVQKDDLTFEVLGDRNSMGIPAVCVARRVRRGATGRKGGASIEPGAAVAFPLLELWAMNKRLLYFNLPEAYFDKPGRMRVWFLRDDRVLWSENLAWPGITP